MKLEYELTEDDVVSFLLFDRRNASRLFPKARNRGTKRLLVMWVVMCLLFLVLFVFLPDGKDENAVLANLAAMLVVLPPMLLITSRLTRRWSIRAQVRVLQKRGFYGCGSLTETWITPEGLHGRQPTGEWRTTWSGFVMAAQNEKGLYLYQTPAMAQIIPRRAFAGEAQAQEFFKTVTGYIDAAKS